LVASLALQLFLQVVHLNQCHQWADNNHQWADNNHQWADNNHQWADNNHQWADHLQWEHLQSHRTLL
jgi:hypothetical protein